MGVVLTCEGLDARALKQPGRAVVVVQLLVRQPEAGVDAAVLLRDLRIVEVRAGSHGGRRPGGGRGREGVRRPRCQEKRVWGGEGVQRAEWSENAAGGLEREDRRGDELLRGDKCVKKLTVQSGQVQEDLCL